MINIIGHKGGGKMIRKSIISMALICFAICAYSKELPDNTLVNQWQNLGKKITAIIIEIDNEFAAKQAIPQLKKLMVQFNRLTTEFSDRQRSDHLFSSRYEPEAIFTLKELRKALIKFNANDTIPFESRQKISKMFKRFKKIKR
jgi:predicted peptidase